MRFYRYCEEGGGRKKHVIKRALLAERGGFEPPKQITVCRISSAVHSTTLPSFRGLYYIIKMFDFTVQYQNIGQLMILRRLCKAKRPAYAYNKVQGHHYWALFATVRVRGPKARNQLVSRVIICSMPQSDS